MKYFKVLFLLGLFLSAVSLGWGAGLSFAGSAWIWLGALFAVGASLMFLSTFGVLRIRAKRQQLHPGTRIHSVSLSNAFRGYRMHGKQPPLFEENFFRSDILSVDTPLFLNFSSLPFVPQIVILEVWAGGSVNVSLGKAETQVSTGQVLRLIPQASDKGIQIDPDANGAGIRVDVLLHFLSPYFGLD